MQNALTLTASLLVSSNSKRQHQSFFSICIAWLLKVPRTKRLFTGNNAKLDQVNCAWLKKGLLCLYILYWVSKGLVCLYILEKVEIWSGDTDASLTDWQTIEDSATQLLYSIQFKLSHAIENTPCSILFTALCNILLISRSYQECYHLLRTNETHQNSKPCEVTDSGLRAVQPHFIGPSPTWHNKKFLCWHLYFFNLWFITLGHTLRWWKITDWWARISKRTCTYLNKCPTWRVGQQPKFRPLMWFSDMGLQVMMKGFILFQLLLRANTAPEVEEYLWMCWAHVLNVPKFSLLLVVAIY